MTSYTVTYKPDTTDRAFLAKLTVSLEKDFRFDDGRADRKKTLSSARYLLVVFNTPAESADRTISADWQFFIDELRWKRKKQGEVILLVPEDFDFSRLSFRLRNCAYFTFAEMDELAQYMRENLTEEDEELSTAAVPEVKQIVYSPRPPAVKQIEFSVRAPGVESFDGSVNIEKHEESGCKEDHIYGDDDTPSESATYEKVSPYTRAARETAAYDYRASRPDADYHSESGLHENKTVPSGNKLGCVVSVVVLFIFGIIIGVFVLSALANSFQALTVPSFAGYARDFAVMANQSVTLGLPIVPLIGA